MMATRLHISTGQPPFVEQAAQPEKLQNIIKAWESAYAD